MTNEQVIKALEFAISSQEQAMSVTKEFLGFVNWQDAEIKRLNEYNETLLAANTDLSNGILEAKPEAIKEFAERLKATITINNTDEGYLDYSIDYNCLIEDIDALVKEMTEGEEDES